MYRRSSFFVVIVRVLSLSLLCMSYGAVLAVTFLWPWSSRSADSPKGSLLLEASAGDYLATLTLRFFDLLL